MSPLPHNGSVVFFFNDTATTEIYTLSLHDALPIYNGFAHDGVAKGWLRVSHRALDPERSRPGRPWHTHRQRRSEEHTSELQSRLHLVCRLLLEKKKNKPAMHE